MTSIPANANLPPLPSASVIQVHDASSERLVVSIEPGKGAGGIGFFAIVWNLFMAVFTAVWGAAFLQQKATGGEFYVCLFLGVFWLIGLGFIFAWIKLKFERVLLSIEPDRVVLRRILLGRQRQSELSLDGTSQAQLTESYKQNDVPVYRVTITGWGSNSLHFGTSLTSAEKDWIVDAINSLLKPPAPPAASLRNVNECEACGAPFPPDAFRSAAGFVICPQCTHQQSIPVNAANHSGVIDDVTELPEELPGIVTILENSVERLGFQLRLIEQAGGRWGIACVAMLFACFWYGMSGVAFSDTLFHGPKGAGNIVFGLFLLPFLCGGLIPVGIGLAALFGRLTTWIDRQQAAVRVQIGPFGKTWRMATPEITAVRLADSSEMPSRVGNRRTSGRNPRVQENSQISQAAALCSGSRILVMTALHQPITSRYVVRLVRRWLSEHGPRPQA